MFVVRGYGIIPFLGSNLCVRLFQKCVGMVLGRVTVEKEVPLRGKGRPNRICRCDSLLLFLSDTVSIEVPIIHADHA